MRDLIATIQKDVIELESEDYEEVLREAMFDRYWGEDGEWKVYYEGKTLLEQQEIYEHELQQHIHGPLVTKTLSSPNSS